jgi:hypothetical protein
LWALKSNIDPDLIEIPDVVLPADMAVQWTALPQEVRNTVINHIRTHAASGSCKQYNAIILTAGFKPSIKTKIMVANLTVLSEIKDLALKTDTDKQSKPNNPQFQINPVDDIDQEVVALRYGSDIGGFNKRNFPSRSLQYRGNGRGGNNSS